jgi:5'-3' exonuclease
MNKQKKGMPFQKCFIDADSIIYRIAVTSDSVAQAKKYYDKAIEDIVWDTASDEGVVAVKGVGNFRFQVAEDYKGQRGTSKVDPNVLKIRKAVTEYAWSLGHFKSDNCEADDVVSIWAQEAMEASVHYVIAHIDKDIDMVEGWHYNFTKKKLYYIDEHEGFYKMCIQMLTGDATDHIQGLKGIGPKKAEKLLADVPTGKLLEVVREAWKDKHPEDWHDRLEVCWNLLYMRRTWDGFRRLTIEETLDV